MSEIDAIPGVFGEDEVSSKFLGWLDDLDTCANPKHRFPHVVIGTTEGVGICLDFDTAKAVALWVRRQESKKE